MFKPTLSLAKAPSLLLLLVMALVGSASAAESIRYTPVPNSSKLRMDGTSTIHNWHADTDVIGGFMEFEATFPDASGTSTPATIKPNVQVKIPVRALKSSGGKRMDAVMQEHMKFEQNKFIQYRVLELAPRNKAAAGAASSQFDARGALTVAGVTRTNTMAITIERLEKTRLKVVGTTALKMTDFGISPPAPDIGLGLIKTGDDVTLTFEWVTEQKTQ